MVTTALSRDLRREQSRLAEQAAAEMLMVFGSLNFKAIDISSPGFVEASISVARRYHRESVELGSDMYLSMRREAGVAGSFEVVQPGFDAVELRKALVVLGPVAAKKLLSQGERIPQAAQTVFTVTSGRVTRMVLDGARETITRSTVADPEAVSYARQVQPGACDFCLLMAENTYNSAYTAMYSAGGRKRAKAPQPAGSKFHDHCRCTVVTLFSGQMPERWHDKQAFKQAWFDATKQGIDPHEFIESTGKGKSYLDAFRQ